MHTAVIVETDSRRVLRSQACQGCRGCGAGTADVEMDLPVGTRISLRPGAAATLMLHSLWLPLLGFVTGGVTLAILNAGDLMQCAGALTGLAAGVVICRRLHFEECFRMDND